MKATWPPSQCVGPIRNWAPKVSWLKWSNRMSIEASSFKIYAFKGFGFKITHLSLSSPNSFCFKLYFGEVLKNATWPPSPRVGPIRNWAPIVSWLEWSKRMSFEASSFKIYVFKSFGFNITHLSSSPYSFYFKPYFGEVLKKATWPPSPRIRPIRKWAPKVSGLQWRCQ